MASVPISLRVPKLTRQEVRALKALWKGEATEYEQKLCLQIIVNKFARAHDLPYVPGKSDESTFLSGRAFVGKQIFRVLKLKIDQLTDEGEE